jgi:hypothetical protein
VCVVGAARLASAFARAASGRRRFDWRRGWAALCAGVAGQLRAPKHHHPPQAATAHPPKQTSPTDAPLSPPPKKTPPSTPPKPNQTQSPEPPCPPARVQGLPPRAGAVPHAELRRLPGAHQPPQRAPLPAGKGGGKGWGAGRGLLGRDGGRGGARHGARTSTRRRGEGDWGGDAQPFRPQPLHVPPSTTNPNNPP